MATVSKTINAKLMVSRSLVDFLKPKGVEKFVERFYKDIARHIAGRHKGQTLATGIIGRHFNRNNQANYGFAPLKPGYAKTKKRKYGNKPILVATGTWRKAARQSMVTPIGDGAVRMEPRNPPKYAEHLEAGTENMPARPAYSVNDRDLKEIEKFGKQLIKERAGELIQFAVGDLQEVK